MAARSFQITMKVPLGEREGRLRWEQRGDVISGVLDIMGHENPFSGHITPCFQLELEGILLTLTREIPYTAKGCIEAGRLRLELEEARHCYLIEGVEIKDA